MNYRLAITSLLALTLISPVVADDHEIIEKAMKDHFKGDTSNIKKASAGTLDKDTVAKLLASCKDLGKAKPNHGDAASWKQKTDALTAAVEALSKGEAGAAEKVKAAANCKACHDVHRPKKDK